MAFIAISPLQILVFTYVVIFKQSIINKGDGELTHFVYMEQQAQMTIFDLEDQYEEMQFRKLSTNVNKPLDKKKKPLKGPRIVGYIVRR